jgi:flagellar basal body rod protein FlgB
MTPIETGPVVDRVGAAMSAATLQQQVIATNIANRDVPGYQRMRLQFDRAMDAAEPARVVADAAGPGSIEADLAAMSANTLHYQSLARMLSRWFSIGGAIVGRG